MRLSLSCGQHKRQVPTVGGSGCGHHAIVNFPAAGLDEVSVGRGFQDES